MSDLNSKIQGIDLLQNININKSLERINNDAARLKDLFKVALSEFPKWPGRLEEAIITGEFDRIRKVAHGFKGSSATIGAERAQRLFLEIENAAKEQNINKIKELFNYLKVELDAAQDIIKNYGK